MEKLLELLQQINADVDFLNEKAIMDDELIDSLDLASLIATIEDTFSVEFELEDVVSDNFNSVEAMWQMIQRLQGKKN